MIHRPATPEPKGFLSVPLYPRLFRRGGNYVFRAKVPERLRPILGKREIVKSLKTADFKAARALWTVENLRVDAEFQEAEAKLNAGRGPEKLQSVANLTDEQIRAIAFRWFIEKESENERWLVETFAELPAAEQTALRTDFRADLADYSDSSTPQGYAPPRWDGKPTLDAFLKGPGKELGVCEGTDAYARLLQWFSLGVAESTARLVKRIGGFSRNDTPPPPVPEFAKLTARSTPPDTTPPAPIRTVADLLADYEKLKARTKKETTVKAIALPLRFIREIIGEATPLNSITRDHLRSIAEAVIAYPVNAVQRFKGLNIKQAIAAGKKAGFEGRDAKTLRNNWIHIVAVFNYAVGEGWMTTNPGKGSWFDEHFPKGKKKSDKKPFSVADLRTIFNAPLYTGCKDDGMGFLTPGPHTIRRGRFWVPLLGLFHGFRLNEACQLLTEDVKGEGPEICLLLREEGEDGKARADKSLKTEQSERRIPLHPELFKLGFADYVNERRAAADSPRLFPTLPLGKTTNRYSNPFSKWFGYFVRHVAPDCKERYHSLRHAFRQAMREAEICEENAAYLGGWEGNAGAMNTYGSGPPLEHLRRDIAKISFPGLDLSHLYPAKPIRVRTRPAKTPT